MALFYHIARKKSSSKKIQNPARGAGSRIFAALSGECSQNLCFSRISADGHTASEMKE